MGWDRENIHVLLKDYRTAAKTSLTKDFSEEYKKLVVSHVSPPARILPLHDCLEILTGVLVNIFVVHRSLLQQCLLEIFEYSRKVLFDVVPLFQVSDPRIGSTPVSEEESLARMHQKW